MTDPLRRHAWAVGLVGAVLGAGAVGRLVLQGAMDGRGVGMALGGALLLVLYAWLDQPQDEVAESSRIVTHASGAMLVVGLATAVAVAAQVGVRGVDTTWDMSSRAGFTLSAQGRAVIEALDRDVQIAGFFRHGTEPARSFDRMARSLPTGRLTVTSHDPLREPVLAERMGVTVEAGQVVVSSGDKREILTERRDEVALVNAILRVTSDADHRVCWWTGHGEANPDGDADDRSYRTAVLALEAQDFQVMLLNTLNGPVDPLCEVVVVAGPTVDATAEERARVWAWLRDGGRVLMLIEPDTVPELAAELAAFGVQLGTDVVLDPAPSRRLAGVDDPSVMVFPLDAWAAHPVARGLSGSLVLGVARQVRPIDDVAGVSVWGLLFTSADAWAERSRDGVYAADAGEERGELAVVSVAEIAGGTRPGRLMVVGDASFATNQLVDIGSNLELFLHAVTWLVGEEERLAPRAPVGETIELTRQELAVMMLLAFVVGPGSAVVAAARLAWRRRRG